MPEFYIGMPNFIQIRLPSWVTSCRFSKWRRWCHRFWDWWHHSFKKI